MAVNFLNLFNQFLRNNDDENATSTEQCEEEIDHYKFYQFSLIPAITITLLFALTKKRKNMFLNILHGRPGLIFPMDSLTRSSRISYACAFGATAFLVYKIVMEQTYAIEFYGHRALKAFVAITSMFIYGMVFFPLFSSLAVGSVFGYALGSLYVWMLTGVEIYRLTECKTDLRTRVLLVMRGLPSLLCMGYLCVSIPARMVIACRKKRYFYWDDDLDDPNSLRDIQASYSGHHVRKLFRKPEVRPPPEDRKGRILAFILSLVHTYLYQRKRGFRYPSRMISVMLISVLVIYTLSFEILSLVPVVFDFLIKMFETVLLELKAEDPTQDLDDENLYFLIFGLIIYFLDIAKTCVIVSTSLATIFALVNILHTLSSYRANLLALYKGDHAHIPPATSASNASHCVNSIKYAGFQVGYNIWSFFLQFVILSLIAFVLALVIVFFIYGFDDWFLIILDYIWPIVVTVIFITVTQSLLAKYVFLQDKGAHLALNNRNFYFNFTYFMFFYNIFLGLFSCLLRIMKAMFLGIVFLSRLDNSTLPRRFEFIDPGFKAYVGFLHIEAAHTNPMAIVFSRLMLLALQSKREREASRQGAKAGADESEASCGKSQPSDVLLQVDDANELKEVDVKVDDVQRRKRDAARFNWHVAYTLLHNPDIRVLRKGYMQTLRQARLLGVSIPVSDRQVDVSMDKLQQDIADAKNRLHCPKKRTKDTDDRPDGTGCASTKDGDTERQTLA